MEGRIFLYAVTGIALIAAVSIQRKLERTLIPFPLIYIAFGWLAFSLPVGLPEIDPITIPEHALLAEYVTEFVVIASLAAAGLAIDRPFSWRCWNQVWPLLLIMMPLSIILVALYGWSMMSLTPASAIFLAAVLSPTDPVLASSVKVGPPGDTARHDIRFNLTVEAGANDGLAFPFVYLGIAAVGMTSLGDWTWQWAGVDLLWRVAAGSIVGYLIGRIGGWYVFTHLPEARDIHNEEARAKNYTSEGVVTLGALLTSYAVAELVHGYGFLAVFISAVTAKQCEPQSHYHALSHHFIDQIERILMVIILLIFGAFLANGILSDLTWQGVLLAFLLVFLIRPLTGMIAQLRCSLPWYGRFTIAFLGVRGIGSLYYLTYGQNSGAFGDTTTIWSAVMFTILLSIIVHGIAAPIMMRKSEQKAAHRL